MNLHEQCVCSAVFAASAHDENADQVRQALNEWRRLHRKVCDRLGPE